ncbi:unnamed protein product [Closterium sp. NIES-53]
MAALEGLNRPEAGDSTAAVVAPGTIRGALHTSAVAPSLARRPHFGHIPGFVQAQGATSGAQRSRAGDTGPAAGASSSAADQAGAAACVTTAAAGQPGAYAGAPPAGAVQPGSSAGALPAGARLPGAAADVSPAAAGQPGAMAIIPTAVAGHPSAEADVSTAAAGQPVAARPCATAGAPKAAAGQHGPATEVAINAGVVRPGDVCWDILGLGSDLTNFPPCVQVQDATGSQAADDAPRTAGFRAPGAGVFAPQASGVQPGASAHVAPAGPSGHTLHRPNLLVHGPGYPTTSVHLPLLSHGPSVQEPPAFLFAAEALDTGSILPGRTSSAPRGTLLNMPSQQVLPSPAASSSFMPSTQVGEEEEAASKGFTRVTKKKGKNEWVARIVLDRTSNSLIVISSHFQSELAVARGGEFSSNLLWDFCCGEGILQSFTLLDSPQKNGIVERCIGLVMEVARTSMIHAAAPHFLWPFAVRYAAHQLNLWPRVSLPETSPTLRWTGQSVPFYRLFPYRSAPPPPPPLFLAPGPPLVDPLPPQGPAPSGVSQVDPLPSTAPVQVAVDLGAAQGAVSGGPASGGAESEGAGSGCAEPRGDELGGAEPAGVETGGVQLGGAELEGAESGGAASSGGPAGALPRLSPQQLREWFVRRARLWSGTTGAGGVGGAEAGGARVTAGAGVTGCTAAASPGGARTRGAGAAGTGGVGGARAGDPTEPGAARAGGSCAGGAGAGGAGAGGAGVGGTGAGGAGARGAGAVDPGAGGAGGTMRPRPYFVQLLQQSSGLTDRREPASCSFSPVRTTCRVPHLGPPPVPGTHAMAIRPSFVPLRVPLPAPTDSSLPDVPDPEFDRALAASPTDSHYATALVAESASATPPSVGGECALGTDVLEDRQVDFEYLVATVPRFASMLLVPEGDPDAPDITTPRSCAEAITSPYSSKWQAAMDADMASWKSTGTYVEEVPPPGANIVDGMWIFRVKRPPGSPPALKARYIARGFRQRQGVDYFQTFSRTPKMTTLWVLLHIAAQRDYELHSLDFSTAFLLGSLHEEIWLRRPPSFTGTFPVGTQQSLRRPVYGLRQAPREWHDTLRTTLCALGFTPSTVDPSLFLRIDTSLPPFYVLVYVDDLVFATANTEALTLVKSELQKRHTFTDLDPSALQFPILLATALSSVYNSLSAPPSDESVEPSGPYPELVGCLMYLTTCTRPDLAYPLSLLAHYVAPGRHRKVHWDAAKRVLRYLCSTSGMGLVIGGRGPFVLTGHADASWVDDSATQRSSCEAEIYAGAMAAQELRWLTYLVTDLGEQPCSPPVLYVDNKAMIALCQEHRLKHQTKHIALRYFLARELQERGQLCLAYMATRANTSDIFTKALPPGDHQCFSTVLGLVPTLPHLLSA